MVLDILIKKRITRARNSSQRLARLMGVQVSKTTSELSNLIQFHCVAPTGNFYMAVFLDNFTKDDEDRIRKLRKEKGLENIPVLVHLWQEGAKQPEEYWIV